MYISTIGWNFQRSDCTTAEGRCFGALSAATTSQCPVHQRGWGVMCQYREMAVENLYCRFYTVMQNDAN